MKRFATAAFLSLSAFCCQLCFGNPPAAELISVKKIWDQAPHSAFTDLIHWNGQFVCAFREGRGHVSADGKIRVLTSPDGATWKSVALVMLDGFDLRDAGLSAAPDGRLMLIGGAAPRKADGSDAPTGSFVSFSKDGTDWTEPHIVSKPGRWLWRVTWAPVSAVEPHEGKAYGVAYAAGSKSRTSSLLESSDGIEFQEVVPDMLDQGWPTEAVLRFDDDGTMICLQRRDGKAPADTAMLGVSRPPYHDWQWSDLGEFFGGPNLIQVPGGEWIAAGRKHTKEGPKTQLARLDLTDNKLATILELPSGGDNSYPGLVWHDDVLWVSYYSSHEGKGSIYLAKAKVQ
jgi:hypothetical protein